MKIPSACAGARRRVSSRSRRAEELVRRTGQRRGAPGKPLFGAARQEAAVHTGEAGVEGADPSPSSCLARRKWASSGFNGRHLDIRGKIMHRTRTLLLGVAASAACGASGALADTATVYSEARRLGDGFAQVYAELDAEGAPRVIGTSFDQGMLGGLPTMPNTWSRCFDKNENGQIDAHGECNGDFELRFALPEELARRGLTPFTWVSVNWNPMGHPPPAPPVWAVPHLDFHFYIMSADAVAQIRPGPCSELIDCDDFERAQIPVPAQYVHADHVDVGAAVPGMGNHLIDSKTPELVIAGREFTHTFIFGAYDGQVTFYEPMVTLAYLQTRPDLYVPIKQPQAWAIEGYYPTTYCIRHLAEDGRYTVSLEDFVHRTGG
jgi:hypothetical protein